MSWIRRNPLTALAALALTLRVACALVTGFDPIFPAYYYTDAALTHSAAAAALGDLAAGRAPHIDGTLSEQMQTLMTLGTYRLFGPHPLAIKLVNSLLGTLAIVALARALSLLFSPRAALAACAAVAVWPSHVFYTSQNLKEAPADLLAYLALWAALSASADPGRPRSKAAASVSAAALLLLGAGFYRSYVLLSLSGGLLLAFALMARERELRARAALGAAAVCLTLAAYPWAARHAVLALELRSPDSPRSTNWERSLPQVFPTTIDERDSANVNRPTSPEGITGFRKTRQLADRRWAKHASDREIGTQIYPDAEFKTWGDVLAYLPKGAFTVMFLPLPGLYPLEGKIGRYAAAGENLVLLTLAVLAAAGILRGPKTPARLGLLGFFTVMAAGAALLEFDLGSAGRHKLLYMPMLFPFAAEAALRLYHGKEPV